MPIVGGKDTVGGTGSSALCEQTDVEEHDLLKLNLQAVFPISLASALSARPWGTARHCQHSQVL